MASYIPVTTAVREMPSEERPRERLARLGPDALRDAELLAILFRTGTREEGAVALADRVVSHFGSLRRLSQATVDELQQIKGVGHVKAVEIKAALALGKRLAAYTKPKRSRITKAADIADLLMDDYKDCEIEVFRTILMDTKHQVLRVHDVSHGGLDATMALPRDVFRAAVREGASAVAICHNHPSGDPEPSRADLDLTKRLVESGDALGVRVLDHVVFGDGRYVSFAERGLM